MLQVIVVRIPCFQLLLQVAVGAEAIPLIEFLLILSVASLYSSVLRRLAGINQVMNDLSFCTESIKGVNGLDRQVAALIRPDTIIGEGRSVICFDCPDRIGKAAGHVLEELYRLVTGLFFIDRQVSPPGGGINGCILVVSSLFNALWHILHIYLQELSGYSLRSDLVVLQFPCPVWSC